MAAPNAIVDLVHCGDCLDVQLYCMYTEYSQLFLPITDTRQDYFLYAMVREISQCLEPS